jgi:general secretion pathway protein F
MPAYHYIAFDKQGKKQKGVIEADTEREARQWLRDRSLLPMQVMLRHRAGEKHFFRRRYALNSKMLALLTRQLAVLLQAGIPVAEALKTLAEQSEHPTVKGLMLSVRGKVVGGHALASALRDHPEAFSSLFVETVAAGEQSGHLEHVLLQLAHYTEKTWQREQKLRTALIYPVIVMLVAFVIVAFLLEYVVPKMIAVYANTHQALPFATVFLIDISTAIRIGGIYGLLLLLVFYYAWRRMLKQSSALRERVHLFLLRLPVIGNTIKVLNSARFLRTFAMLSQAGVPVVEAMQIAASLISPLPMRRAVLLAASQVREGKAVHLALKQANYFSPMSIHMIASGEASGELGEMLERIGQTQEEELSRLIDTSLALFEPLMILVIGAIVLFIVLAVLLPIFDLNQF